MNDSLKYIFSHAHLNIKTRKPFVCLCARCPHFSVRWNVLREVQHGPFHWGGKRTLWTRQDLLNGQQAKYLCLGWILCFPQRLSRLPRGSPACASWLFHLASLWTQLDCALGTFRAHSGHTWLTVTYKDIVPVCGCHDLGSRVCGLSMRGIWLRGSSSQGLGHWAICGVGEGL